jgi:hypothetical protein
MRLIRPGLTRVPWWWAGVLAVPAAAGALSDYFSSTALTFTLDRFTEDPALISLIVSINMAFNFMVAPVASWLSDRGRDGSARFQRRRQLMVLGWLIAAAALLAIPGTGSLSLLVLLVVLMQFGVDVGHTACFNPLYFSVVPRQQRGRAVVIKRAGMIGVKLLFNLFLIGQFDEQYDVAGLSFTGEHVVYAFAAMAALSAATVILVALRHDRPGTAGRNQPTPDDAPCRREGNRLTLRELWQHQGFRAAALLVVPMMMVTTKLGPMKPLMITKQFGYSKKMMGAVLASIMVTEMVVALPLLATFIDRIARLRLLRIALATGTVIPIAMWCWLMCGDADGIPSLPLLIVFLLGSASCRISGSLACEPLFYDLAPRSAYGRANSVIIILRGALRTVTFAGVGFWVKLVAHWRGEVNYTDAMLYVALAGLIGSFMVFTPAASRIFALHDQVSNETSNARTE